MSVFFSDMKNLKSAAFWGFFLSGLFCLFLIFLQSWGDPSWFRSIPLAYAYQFMDALLVYTLSCFIYFSFKFFVPVWKTGRILFILSFLPCLGYALLVIFGLGLNITSLFRRWFFPIAWVASGLLSGFYIVKNGLRSGGIRGYWSKGIIITSLLILLLPILLKASTFSGIISSVLFLGAYSATFLIQLAFSNGHRFYTPPEYTPEIIFASLKKYGISEREGEVVELLLEGKRNQEIADSLFISLSTVKTHLSRIYEKTGTRNRLEAARLFRHESQPKV